MTRFPARLVPGRKPPYDTWNFVELPPEAARALGGRWPRPVRGTLAGTPFRGTAARGEGVVRVPFTREWMGRAGVARGEVVEVALELDPEPRPVEVPAELARLLDADADLAARFERLAPSMRRAWADHVAGAKRPETRLRRAKAAPAGIRAREWPK
jgi:hypothetical protein